MHSVSNFILNLVMLCSFGRDLNIIHSTKRLNSNNSRIFDIAKYYILFLLKLITGLVSSILMYYKTKLEVVFA